MEPLKAFLTKEDKLEEVSIRIAKNYTARGIISTPQGSLAL
jgi:hypothetical protein